AEKTPEKIFKEVIDPVIGLMPYQAKRLAFNINIPKESVNKAAKLMLSLYKVFTEKDCAIVEINPLVSTGYGDVLALDAKINFDENALFRNNDIVELRDLDEEDPKEIEASKYDLSYVALDGNIGCMVNGAGLAMATMDTINHFVGKPANFVDEGGGATTEKVTEAFKINLGAEGVRGMVINLFRGMMTCSGSGEG